MAITPSGAIYKSLTFDGKTSREFGVYITGEAVYNAAERDVEFIDIPGRNGAFALDNGRFSNIAVSYPAGMFADTDADFAQGISDFRNWLCSRRGYVRLTDDYNPGEYRLAVYRSGLEVDPSHLKSGEFTITFDCMPQRFLTSGETAVSVTSGSAITNPTLFESKPMLLVEGYGDIDIDGQPITVENVPVGDVFLANGKSFSIEYPKSGFGQYDELAAYTFEAGKLKTGDNIYVDKSIFVIDYIVDPMVARLGDTLLALTITTQTGAGANTTAVIRDDLNGSITTTFDPITFTMGTASSVTHYFECKEKIGKEGGGYQEATNPCTVVIAYDGANKITFSAERISSSNFRKSVGSGNLGDATGYSTLTVSGVISIDLDVGEAYWTSGGDVISADFAVSLPAELPTLVPGANTITYDNTFTSFQVVPRWWKI